MAVPKRIVQAVAQLLAAFKEDESDGKQQDKPGTGKAPVHGA